MRRRGFDETVPIPGRCRVLNLALLGGGTPCAAPVNFGHKVREGDGAGEGRKIDATRGSPPMSFCAEILGGTDGGGEPCGRTAYHESVVGFGRARTTGGSREKAAALAGTAVVEISVDETTGKRRLR